MYSNWKATPFASRDGSRKARQKVVILGEATPFCRNAAAAILSREPFRLRVKLRRTESPETSEALAKEAGHWLLDSALLCAFPADSGMAFQVESTP